MKYVDILDRSAQRTLLFVGLDLKPLDQGFAEGLLVELGPSGRFISWIQNSTRSFMIAS